jgi:hypothetical protein
VIEHEVRFITSPLEDYQPISPVWWEYKAKIEIKQREIMAKDEFNALHGAGIISLKKFNDSLKEIIT